MSLDAVTHVAEIQGRRVDLGGDNVVLVDHVDSVGDFSIAGLVRVDSQVASLRSGRPDIDAVLATSEDIVSYLRCDVLLPGGKSADLVSPTCGRMLGKEAKPAR